MFRGALLFVALTLSAATASAQDAPKPPKSGVVEQPKGTICVLPNSAQRPTRISPGGDYNPATLKVRLDDREPIPWPHKGSVKIEGIPVEGKHLLVLISDGKPIQSTRFRFSNYKDLKLCLFFDGYQGIQLDDEYNALWCKCK